MHSHFLDVRFATEYGKVCRMLLKFSAYGFQVMFLVAFYLCRTILKRNSVNQ